jgi:hypothetical protein
MIVVATDAPVDARQLERMAKRAFMALAKTGSFASNGSGDYVIAFSANPDNFVEGEETHTVKVLDNDQMSPLFAATVEATAEALWNSLFAAETTKGVDGKVIEALPDVNQILIKNAVSDIARLCRECSVNLEEHPFNTKINGKMTSVALVDYIDGRVVAYNHDGKVVSDEYACDFLVGLRDHINIEVLHRSNEYKELMELLSLEENMRFECQNYGDATFVIDGTDVTFDISSVRRSDKGNLVIYGNDIDADVCDNIELTEKDIKHEYLVGIINEIKRGKYYDIMNTYNGHNAELVRKINAAWRYDKYHDKFSEILLALLVRDHEEYIDKYCEIEDYSGDWAMEHAHEIMEGVCDDWDLETILSFIRYKE